MSVDAGRGFKGMKKLLLILVLFSFGCQDDDPPVPEPPELELTIKQRQKIIQEEKKKEGKWRGYPTFMLIEE